MSDCVFFNYLLSLDSRSEIRNISLRLRYCVNNYYMGAVRNQPIILCCNQFRQLQHVVQSIILRKNGLLQFRATIWLHSRYLLSHDGHSLMLKNQTTYTQPARIFSSVDFPAPDGPIIAVSSPDLNSPVKPFKIILFSENK